MKHIPSYGKMVFAGPSHHSILPRKALLSRRRPCPNGNIPLLHFIHPAPLFLTNFMRSTRIEYEDHLHSIARAVWGVDWRKGLKFLSNYFDAHWQDWQRNKLFVISIYTCLNTQISYTWSRAGIDILVSYSLLYHGPECNDNFINYDYYLHLHMRTLQNKIEACQSGSSV